jgi:single-strand DNA-binding protein
VCQCVNRVTLIGFLGDAPELKFSQQGKPVCTFSLAVNERWKDPAGAPRGRVEWFQIVCFARLAEVCGEYLNKGRHVYLEGRLQTRKWKGPEGEKRTAIEVVANQMQILDRAPKNGNDAKAPEPSKPAGPVDESDNPFNKPGSATTDQEIPF